MSTFVKYTIKILLTLTICFALFGASDMIIYGNIEFLTTLSVSVAGTIIYLIIASFSPNK